MFLKAAAANEWNSGSGSLAALLPISTIYIITRQSIILRNGE